MNIRITNADGNLQVIDAETGEPFEFLNCISLDATVTGMEFPLPPGFPFDAPPTDEERAAGARRLEETGRRWAERREKLILDLILGNPVCGILSPLLPEVAGRIVYEATLHHGEGLTDDDAAKFIGRPVKDETRTNIIGRVARAERRGNFIVGMIEFDEGKAPLPEHIHNITLLDDGLITLTAEQVIHEARKAAGCKPGESLIERCRKLAAVVGTHTTSVVIKKPTPEDKERLKDMFARELREPTILELPIASVQYHQAVEDIRSGEWVTLAADGGVKRCPNQDELREAYGRLMDRKRLEEVCSAMKRGATDLGKVAQMLQRDEEFAKAKGIAATVVQEIVDAVAPLPPDEPNPETWRDKPPML